jgi:hypothetical protein
MYTAQAFKPASRAGSIKAFADEWDAVDFCRGMFLNGYDVSIFAPAVSPTVPVFDDSHICPHCGSWNDGHFAKRWPCFTCRENGGV